MKKALAIFGMIILLTVAAFAADLSGTWNTKVDLGWRGSGTPTFVLKQDGDKLSGNYSGAFGQSKVTGTVKGSDVILEFEASGMKVRYTGKVDPDGAKMEGSVDYGGRVSGTFTASKKK
jgi:opacity protein-like surface antigen